jgi:putative FmdB family regulatory protein
MPIYEYDCKECGEQFELLIRPGTAETCPGCGGEKIVKLLSLPAVKSSATRELAMRSAKKRDAAQGKEQLHAQLEYERNHD